MRTIFGACGGHICLVRATDGDLTSGLAGVYVSSGNLIDIDQISRGLTWGVDTSAGSGKGLHNDCLLDLQAGYGRANDHFSASDWGGALTREISRDAMQTHQTVGQVE